MLTHGGPRCGEAGSASPSLRGSSADRSRVDPLAVAQDLDRQGIPGWDEPHAGAQLNGAHHNRTPTHVRISAAADDPGCAFRGPLWAHHTMLIPCKSSRTARLRRAGRCVKYVPARALAHPTHRARHCRRAARYWTTWRLIEGRHRPRPQSALRVGAAFCRVVARKTVSRAWPSSRRWLTGIPSALRCCDSPPAERSIAMSSIVPSAWMPSVCCCAPPPAAAQGAARRRYWPWKIPLTLHSVRSRAPVRVTAVEPSL